MKLRWLITTTLVIIVASVAFLLVNPTPKPALANPSGGWASSTSPGRANMGYPVFVRWLRPGRVTLTGVQLIPVPGYRLPPFTATGTLFPKPPKKDLAIGITRSCRKARLGQIELFGIEVTNSSGPGTIDAAAGVRLTYTSEGSSFSVDIGDGAFVCWSAKTFSCPGQSGGAVGARIVATQHRLGVSDGLLTS